MTSPHAHAVQLLRDAGCCEDDAARRLLAREILDAAFLALTHWLDPISFWISGVLLNATPIVEWSAAGAITATAYGTALWFIWRHFTAATTTDARASEEAMTHDPDALELVRLEAPFTPLEVLALNRWQTLGYVHPFTCGSRGDGNHGDGEGALVATVRGWICPFCDYTQNWAHNHMTLPEPPMNPMDIIKAARAKHAEARREVARES